VTSGALAFIGLGSNIEPEANLRVAARLLAEHPALSVTAVSPVYRTPPWGPVPQGDYLNAVVALRTGLSAEALLDALQAIEAQRGRERSPQAVRWGPRTLDLDLLLYGDSVIETPRLVVPHPRLAERAFALVPLCDLAPALKHPLLGRTMAELLEAVSREGIVRVPVNLTPSALSGRPDAT
jgi:2-amino-4-hydroxy-6-hydroxymethyldihydropteridine diphosphokinase